MNDDTAIALYAGRLETLVEPVDISAIMGTVPLPVVDDHPRRRTLVAAAMAVLVAVVVVAAVLLAGNGREDGVDTVAPAPVPIATSTIPEGWVTVSFSAMHDAPVVQDDVTVFGWVEFPDGSLESRWEVIYQRVAVVNALPEAIGADGVRRSRVTMTVPPEAGQLIATAGGSGASLAVSAGPEVPEPVSGSDPTSFPGYPTFPGNMDGESQVDLEDPTPTATSLQTVPVDEAVVFPPDPTAPEVWVPVTVSVLHAEATLPPVVDTWYWIVCDQTPPLCEPHWERIYASVTIAGYELERVLPSGARLSRVTFTVPPQAAEMIASIDATDVVTAVSTPEGPIKPCSLPPEPPCLGEPDFRGDEAYDWIPVFAPDHDGTVYVPNAFMFGFESGEVGEAVNEGGDVVGYWVDGIGFVEIDELTPTYDWRSAVRATHAGDTEYADLIIEAIEERGGLGPIQTAPELPEVWPPSSGS